MDVFDVVTVHGTRLFMERETGRVRHGPKPIDGPVPIDGPTLVGDHVPLLLWAPADRKGVGFLIPAERPSVPLHLSHDPEHHDVLSLRVWRDADGTSFLYHPLTGFLLCPVPVEGGVGPVEIDRREAGAWERVSLEPMASVPAYVQQEVRQLRGLLQRLHDGPAVLAYLYEGATPSPSHFAQVLRVLPPKQIEWVGRALATAPEAARLLTRALPDDLWAAHALPDLVRWQGGTAGPRIRLIDERFDVLMTLGFGGKYASAAHMCSAFARRSAAPRGGICIVATARNEAPYLLEWIAYHREIGVEAFFIYTNDNNDGSDEMLSILAGDGVITLIHNRVGPGIGPQGKAYGHAFQMLPDVLGYDWAAVIDVDEFIVFDTNRFASLPDFIASITVRQTDAIALNWVVYTAHHEIFRSDVPVTQRCLHREPTPNFHVKAISRPSQFIHSQCHFPIWDDFTAWSFRTASGTPHVQDYITAGSAFAKEPTDQGAWINHYFTKSAEEFVMRRTRGRGDIGLIPLSTETLPPPVAHYFRFWFDSPASRVDTRALACAPHLDQAIATLRSLPGMVEVLALVAQRDSERLKQVVDLLATDPRFQQPGTDEAWFTPIMAEAATRAELRLR
ncbi:glycosyltransferase family 2 protein [Acidisphaera sp. L21]|uniref:glycosyltransferase family 2 protein n=1 Tax=Acidisphaera sp. L21 TaxID=1641851 RepID=UPI00131ECD0C|nr:glycosyltransferase family 2 protein [Acidisphaera sp. L21]